MAWFSLEIFGSPVMTISIRSLRPMAFIPVTAAQKTAPPRGYGVPQPEPVQTAPPPGFGVSVTAAGKTVGIQVNFSPHRGTKSSLVSPKSMRS